jgi:signal peptidase I
MSQAPEKKKHFIKDSLPLIYLIVALLALRWTIVEPYVVPTGSMEPTLKPGDRLYALKCAYDVRFPFTEWILFRTGKVERGDVILFRNPVDPSITFVKRAIGLPGDKVKFQDGVYYVNGQPVPRETTEKREVMYDIESENTKTLYVEKLDNLKHWVILDRRIDRFYEEQELRHRSFAEREVPAGHFFAVGDNRDNSHDSRAWGFVPFENLKGEAMFIWYSSRDWFEPRFERIGTLIQ